MLVPLISFKPPPNLVTLMLWTHPVSLLITVTFFSNPAPSSRRAQPPMHPGLCRARISFSFPAPHRAFEYPHSTHPPHRTPSNSVVTGRAVVVRLSCGSWCLSCGGREFCWEFCRAVLGLSCGCAPLPAQTLI